MDKLKYHDPCTRNLLPETYELDLIDRSDVTLNLVNSLGQTVYTSAKSLDAGIQKIEVSTASLSAGLYFVNVNVDGISKTLRLNVAH